MRLKWIGVVAVVVLLYAVITEGWHGGDADKVEHSPPKQEIRTEEPFEEPFEERSPYLTREPLLQSLAIRLNDQQVTPEQLPEWLIEFAEAYDPQREPIEAVRADLDGDESAAEWAVVLFEEILHTDKDAVERRTAYGAIISHKEDRYELHGFEFPEESYGRANIAAVDEMTGDGKPDVIWVSYAVGAHTTLASYTVTSLVDGELQTVGTAEIPNVSNAEVREGVLMLTGGVIGSAGAGLWQREYTESFIVKEDTLLRVDRTYSTSPTSYHRLIDGLWAEAFGHTERAKKLLAESIELRDDSYLNYSFTTPDGGAMDGGTDPEMERNFQATVKQFARFRLELLTQIERGGSREDACARAKRETGYDASWIPVLNAPFGYANPMWDEDTICSAIDRLNY